MRGETPNLDETRRKALDRIDQASKRFRMLVMVTAVVELALILFVLYVTDFKNPDHLVVFACTLLVYIMMFMALVVFGAWLGKAEARILKAIEVAE